MKTQNTNLAFKRDSIIELNDDSMNNVKGGTSSWVTSIPGLIATAILDYYY